MEQKVGIITLRQITNYGGILQAYALQHVIGRLGYDVEVVEISKLPKELSVIQKCTLYSWRTFLKKVLHKKVAIRREENVIKKEKQLKESAINTMPFIKKHIPHRYVKSFNEIQDGDYRALVVGSDQIWRPAYALDVDIQIEDAYLRFAKNMNVNRIAYAPSFGSEEWEYTEEQTKECRELLSLFKAVSCREEAGTEFCKRYLKYPNAITVIDPTMLLNKQDYLSLIDKYDEPLVGDLMCYILDANEQTNKIVDSVASQKSLTPFSVITKAKYTSDAPLEDRMQPPVEKWLKGFRDAKFVITDSYHACVFSIIFRKPFIAFVNSERGIARYKTLLSYFGLENRLVVKWEAEQIQEILKRPMAVDENVLSGLQEKAMTFLKTNL